MAYQRKFAAYWWFVGWSTISFGISVDLAMPNIDIHLPFGFVRIGWIKFFEQGVFVATKQKPFGYHPQQRETYVGVEE